MVVGFIFFPGKNSVYFLVVGEKNNNRWTRNPLKMCFRFEFWYRAIVNNNLNHSVCVSLKSINFCYGEQCTQWSKIHGRSGCILNNAIGSNYTHTLRHAITNQHEIHKCIEKQNAFTQAFVRILLAFHFTVDSFCIQLSVVFFFVLSG